MSLKKLLDKNNLHHAYCMEGDIQTVTAEIVSFVEQECGVKTEANPDFHVHTFETLSIEDSRLIKERQQKKSFGPKKFFIISFSFITREAQNALLKIFEEPTAYTHFFIITQSVSVLLPTLRSRLVVISVNREKQKSRHNVQAFLKENSAQRLTRVKTIIETKDRSQAITFLNELEMCVGHDRKYVSMYSKHVQDLLMCKKNLFSQGASSKLVLEHIALTFPKI